VLVSIRPLGFLLGLTLCDYVLWNWSLNGNHDVIALISGLTLPALALACAWRIVLLLARGIAGSRHAPQRLAARVSRARPAAARGAAGAPARGTAGARDGGRTPSRRGAEQAPGEAPRTPGSAGAGAGSAGRSSGKIAA
jgi:hypothetical protein